MLSLRIYQIGMEVNHTTIVPLLWITSRYTWILCLSSAVCVCVCISESQCRPLFEEFGGANTRTNTHVHEHLCYCWLLFSSSSSSLTSCSSQAEPTSRFQHFNRENWTDIDNANLLLYNSLTKGDGEREIGRANRLLHNANAIIVSPKSNLNRVANVNANFIMILFLVAINWNRFEIFKLMNAKRWCVVYDSKCF